MSNINQIQRVSDIISPNEIAKWDNQNVVVISAGTGAGKSYFIKNKLYQFAKSEGKKILFLLHRSNCVTQFQSEIERDKKTDVIEIKTYQSIEHSILKNQTCIDFSQYKYVVNDEFHYYVCDAGFNKTTDISFNAVMDAKNCIRIFMSATGDEIQSCLFRVIRKNYKPRIYPLEPDYSHIRKLVFFNKKDSKETILKQILSSGEKAIFFIQSVKEAYTLYKAYKDKCLFNCSKYSDHYKYVDEVKINSMLEHEKFEEQVLITTSCFDAGANIIDLNVKHILADIVDVNSLVQCLGRKRTQNSEDNITVYIQNITNNRLGGFLQAAKKDIEMANYLKKHNTQMLVEKYPRQVDKSYIIYDESKRNKQINQVTKKINQLIYAKKQYDITTFEKILKEGSFGYCKFIAKKFGRYDKKSDWCNYELLSEDYSLETYLESCIGNIMLQVKDRKELIKRIDVRSNGRQLKSLLALNSALEERQVEFKIVLAPTSRMINGKQKKYTNAWKVKKIDDG